MAPCLQISERVWSPIESPPEDQPLVVVADADRAAGVELADRLARHGFRASYTPLGAEVLSLVQAGPVAAVIVDVALGDMSGHALAARLRAFDHDLHVLMTTADFRPEFEVRARQIGILHYAQKPVDPVRLEAILSKAVAASRHA